MNYFITVVKNCFTYVNIFFRNFSILFRLWWYVLILTQTALKQFLTNYDENTHSKSISSWVYNNTSSCHFLLNIEVNNKYPSLKCRHENSSRLKNSIFEQEDFGTRKRAIINTRERCTNIYILFCNSNKISFVSRT